LVGFLWVALKLSSRVFWGGMQRLMRPLALAVLVACLDAAVVPTWGAAGGRSLRLSPARALSPSRLSLFPLRGGTASTNGIPVTAAPSHEDGKVFLKLSLNYGVEGGSIVAVGPSSCFGGGDIHRRGHKSRYPPPRVARWHPRARPRPVQPQAGGLIKCTMP
jgi:hypothetical protein